MDDFSLDSWSLDFSRDDFDGIPLSTEFELEFEICDDLNLAFLPGNKDFAKCKIIGLELGLDDLHQATLQFTANVPDKPPI